MNLEDTLRRHLATDPRTHYAIGKEAGIAPAMLDRFASGERGLRLDTASKLAGVLGLELVKRTRENKRKSPRAAG